MVCDTKDFHSAGGCGFSGSSRLSAFPAARSGQAGALPAGASRQGSSAGGQRPGSGNGASPAQRPAGSPQRGGLGGGFQALLVETATPKAHVFHDRLEVFGELKAYASVEVMSRVSGRRREMSARSCGLPNAFFFSIRWRRPITGRLTPSISISTRSAQADSKSTPFLPVHTWILAFAPVSLSEISPERPFCETGHCTIGWNCLN